MKQNQKKRNLFLYVAILCIIFSFYFLWHLVDYTLSASKEREMKEEFQSLYYASEKKETSLGATVPTDSVKKKEGKPSASQAAFPEIPYLTPIPYPNNKHLYISSRFQTLRKQNKDIIAWISLKPDIDYAVVQRDNTYYLTRDYRGRSNDNGALFLDETIDLFTRPYTLVIYGHNMRTGAMFGNLRKYKQLSHYKQYSFLSFDTIYEDGTFVIFAAADISSLPRSNHYINLASLSTCTIQERQDTINEIRRYSFFANQIDVQAEDQLLFLVTCTGKDEERLVIAARRIRENETRESIEKIIKMSWTK